MENNEDDFLFEEEDMDFLFEEPEEEIEMGDILIELEEPEFNPPRKITLSENLIEFAYPEKKRFRSTVYHIFKANYNYIKAYEVIPVNAFPNRDSIPEEKSIEKAKDKIFQLGEVFIFGLTSDETDWYAFDVFIPKDKIHQVARILEEKTNRPQLKGITHYGNLAAVKYVLSKCQILYQYKLKLCDWIKTSKFTRPHGDKLESYVPKEDEASPPELYVCKEGIAQVFKEEDPAILHQMSTFWPWNMIKKVYEKEDKMIFEWVGDDYSFEQLISDETERTTLMNKIKNAFENGRKLSVEYAPFVRSNSFPSHDRNSWITLEPYGCEVSRVKGLPPLKES
ncbi:MAG: hypothetical protein ACTSYQ_05095 [Candidatus Odinarchaeia archaeon]